MSDIKVQERTKSEQTASVAQNKPVSVIGTLNLGIKNAVLFPRIMSIVDGSVIQYKAENHDIVKKCAKAYIHKNISERGLLRFMLSSFKYEHMDFMLADYVSYDLSEYEESEYITDVYSSKIRENQRWFNDLMLYLNGKYTDGQLLNSDFFRVIQNKHAQQMFIANTQRIDLLTQYKAKATQQKVGEAKSTIEKFANENQRQEQK